MRPPLPYGQSGDAFSGFGKGNLCFLYYVCVQKRKSAVEPESQVTHCPIGIEGGRKLLQKKFD